MQTLFEDYLTKILDVYHIKQTNFTDILGFNNEKSNFTFGEVTNY